MQHFQTIASVSGRAERYAAIDIGSGRVRLIIMDIGKDGDAYLVARQPITCRLVEGITPTQENPVIQRTKMNIALGAMRTFKALIEEYRVPPQNILAGCTEAIRAVREKNPRRAEGYRARLSASLGHDCVILSGEEEATLIGMAAAMGAASHFRKSKPIAVCNVGNGSSQQAILTSKGEILRPTSIPYGIATLYEEAFHDLGLARQLYSEKLEEKFSEPQTDVIVALGGTWRQMRHVVCTRGSVVEGRRRIAKELARATMLTEADYRLLEKDIAKRAGEMPTAAVMLEAFAHHTRAKKLIFVSQTMAMAMIEVLHRQRQTNAPVPGLERLFSLSAPSPAPHV